MNRHLPFGIHRFCFILLCAAVLSLFAPAYSQTMLILTTNQTGTQPVDVSDSLVWNFALTSGAPAMSTLDFYLDSKVGSSTSVPLVLNLYSGLGGTGTLLATVSRSPSDFTTNGYNLRLFELTGLNLTAGNDYSITFTSSTGIGGSSQYFTKIGALQTTGSETNFVLSDGGNGTTSTSTSAPTQTVSATSLTLTDSTMSQTQLIPEPSSLSLLLPGVAVVGGLARRKLRS